MEMERGYVEDHYLVFRALSEIPCYFGESMWLVLARNSVQQGRGHEDAEVQVSGTRLRALIVCD